MERIEAKVLCCDILVSGFKRHLHYYVHFRTNSLAKSENPFNRPVMG